MKQKHANYVLHFKAIVSFAPILINVLNVKQIIA